MRARSTDFNDLHGRRVREADQSAPRTFTVTIRVSRGLLSGSNLTTPVVPDSRPSEKHQPGMMHRK